MSGESNNDDVQTFAAATLREALAAVRAELGPDALIIAQNQTGAGFEVRAAMELPLRAPPLDEPIVVAEPPRPEELGADVQVHLGAQSERGVSRGTHAHSCYDDVVLEDFPGVVDIDLLRRTILSRLNYMPRRTGELAGTVRFIGGPGVGKTSAVVRVLARWLESGECRDVQVISTDDERLAGTEALRIACQALGVALTECPAAELRTVLAHAGATRLTLIDTPAIQPGTDTAELGLATPQSRESVQDIWVTSATHGAMNVVAQLDAIAGLPLAGTFVSHCDAALDMDPLLNLLYRRRLPVWWLSTGAALPDELAEADAQVLAERFFDLGAEQADERPGAHAPEIYFGAAGHAGV